MRFSIKRFIDKLSVNGHFLTTRENERHRKTGNVSITGNESETKQEINPQATLHRKQETSS